MSHFIMSRFAVVFAVITLVACQAHGGVITSTLGEQDFSDGSVPSFTPFNNASSNEPAPFDGFRGSDISDTDNFDVSFTHAFGALTSANSATFTFGIFDHDSQADGSQLASFLIDGNDLTAELDNLFETRGGSSGEYNVYTIALPTSSLADLLDGSATISLALQGPPLGFANLGEANGAGLDFATLTIETGSDGAVPEPTSWASFSVIGMLGLLMRRRKTILAK